MWYNPGSATFHERLNGCGINDLVDQSVYSTWPNQRVTHGIPEMTKDDL
jgi:hypothetical protein